MLVGLSAGWELWGLLGVALLAPVRGAGDFHMFEFRWTIAGPTVPGAILGAGDAFTWKLGRLAHGAIAIVVGVAAARLLRKRPESLWIVPALVVLTKIRARSAAPSLLLGHAARADLLGVPGLAARLWEDAQARGERDSLLHRRIAGGRAKVDQRDDALVSG